MQADVRSRDSGDIKSCFAIFYDYGIEWNPCRLLRNVCAGTWNLL